MPHRFLPGTESWLASDSPTSSFSVVFEDDGATAYVYPYDRAAADGKGAILDACHLYNVHNVIDRHLESELEIRWTADGLWAGVFINQYPHALVDFANRRAYCRSNWPPPTGPWGKVHSERAPWQDDLATSLEWA